MTTALARRSNTPGRHVYDVIIVGGDVAAALAAALLAKRGLTVLCVEHEAPGPGYEKDGWLFPWAPLVTPPFKSMPVLEEILAEVGVSTELSRLVRPAAPPMQVLRNGERYDLPADGEARAKELGRALGAAEAKRLQGRLDGAASASGATDAFVQTRPDLAANGFFERWKLRRLLARTPELETATPLETAQPAEKLLLALARQCASVAAPGVWSQARVAGRLVPTPQIFPGGRAALREQLLARARDLGADVVGEGEGVGSIAFEGSKPVGLRLSRGETTYRSGALLTTLDVEGLGRVIPAERQKGLAKLAPRLAPTHALFTLSAVVPESALPRGLGELALLEPRDPELDLVRLHVGPARKSGATEDSAPHRLLTAVLTVPLALRQGGAAVVPALVERTWAELDAVLPFTRKHVVVQSTPWLDAPQVAGREVELHALYALAPTAPAGVVGLPSVAPWSRCFFAGRPVLPGLGLEGEALSTLVAARRIEALLKKNDPLKSRRPQP